MRRSAGRMNILVADGLDAEALAFLRKVHDVHVQEVDAARLLTAIPSFHALIVRGRTKVTKEVLGRGSNLKVVGRAGVGVDNIDVETATARKIVVVNAPTASTVSVAELAIGHMISLARHLPMADRSVKEGRWEKKGLEGRELSSKVLGLLGSGRIGGEVAKRARAFGMEVIAFDPYLSLPTADSLGIRLVDKESLFRDADFVSVHAALTPETKGLVGREELALMKRTAVLVNCARGEIVRDDRRGRDRRLREGAPERKPAPRRSARRLLAASRRVNGRGAGAGGSDHRGPGAQGLGRQASGVLREPEGLRLNGKRASRISEIGPVHAAVFANLSDDRDVPGVVAAQVTHRTTERLFERLLVASLQRLLEKARSIREVHRTGAHSTRG